MAFTEFGFCITSKTTTPDLASDGHIHGDDVSTEMIDVTLAYNLSDWTAGYFGEIGGYIAYFSAPGHQTELRDVENQVVLSGGQSTRITLRTLHQINMPPPLGYLRSPIKS